MNALPGLGHFPASDLATRRFREAGDLTLDLSHQDGRVEDRWLGLEPAEFAIIWRLAERPGEAVSATAQITDLWRTRLGRDGGEVAGFVASLTAKLAAAGLAGLVMPRPEGSYALVAGTLAGHDQGTLTASPATGQDAADR